MSFQQSFTPALHGNSTILINAMRRRMGAANATANSSGGGASANFPSGGSVNGFGEVVAGSGSLSDSHSSPPLTPKDRKLGVLFV